MQHLKLAERRVLYEVPQHESHFPGHQAFDMHMHSIYSDGTATPLALAFRAAELGIGISITDHNEIRGCLDAYELEICPVIFGIEVASQQGLDTLVYFEKVENYIEFFEKEIKYHRGLDPSSFTDIPIMDVMKKAKDYEGYTVLAHPYGPGWKNCTGAISRFGRKLLDRVDGIECCNGSLSLSRNVRAYRLALQWHKAVLGGSDAHSLATSGDVITLFEKSDRHHPTAAIDRRETKVIGSRSRPLPRAYGHSRMVFKHAQFWPSIVLKKLKLSPQFR
jgi:predicted metal-dependent phosphoesterase TrpH